MRRLLAVSMLVASWSSTARANDDLIARAEAFRAKGNVARAIAAYRQVVASAPKSQLADAQRARAALAELYGELGVFDYAAEWLESFVRTSPTDPRSADALARAVAFRLGTENPDRAREDAIVFARLWGRTRPMQFAVIALRLVEDAALRDAMLAPREIEQLRRAVARGGLDVQMAFEAVVARASRRFSPVAWQRVSSLFTTPEAAMRSLQESYANETEESRRDRLKRIVDLAAEARAESKAGEGLDEIVPPLLVAHDRGVVAAVP